MPRLPAWEQGEHAIHGARHARRVKRRQHEVPRFRGLERDVHRLLVADLADEDDVGVLPERGAQGVREAPRVDADLALAHARLLVAMKELDGILHRHDVEGLRAVQVADHRRDRGALSVARRADDEHQPALFLAERQARRRASELIERRDHERDGAHHDRQRAALAEDVHPEAPDAARRVGRVVLGQGIELQLHRVVADDVRRQHVRIGREERLGAEVDDLTANARPRRLPDLQVDVARLGRNGLGQELHQVIFARVQVRDRAPFTDVAH